MKVTVKLFWTIFITLLFISNVFAFDEIRILRGGEDYGRDKIKSILTDFMMKQHNVAINSFNIEIFDKEESDDEYKFETLRPRTSINDPKKLFIFKRMNTRYLYLYLANQEEAQILKDRSIVITYVDKCTKVRSVLFNFSEYYGVLYL